METNKVTYRLIEQYIQGKLDEKAMHELEKQALDDPFLADALEGYARAEAPSGLQLSLLQKQLEERIAIQNEKKNVFYFTWQRISVAAAASLLFISAGILFWMKGSQHSQTALNQKQVEVNLMSRDSLPANQPAKTIQPTSDTAREVALADNLIVEGEERPSAAQSVDNAVYRKKSIERKKAASVMIAKTQATDTSVLIASHKGPVLAAVRVGVPSQVADPVNFKKKVGELEKLSATRVDQGRTASDTVLNVASYTAKRSAEAQAGQSRSLKELVAKVAVPVGGWSAFIDYLQKNKRFTEPLPKAGAVVLTFKTDAAGSPVEINVKSGLSESYNTEAVRLLENGPKWPASLNFGEVIVPFEKYPQ